MDNQDNHDLRQVEDAVLNLSESDRAALAEKILLSLESTSIDEIESDWVAEAERRAHDLDTGIAKSIPANEVLEKAKKCYDEILFSPCC